MVLCDSDDEYEVEAPLYNTVIQELVFSSHKKPWFADFEVAHIPYLVSHRAHN